MDKKRIEVEATLALQHLRPPLDKPDDRIAIVGVMQNACDAVDKGDCGEQAVKALLNLWQQLKLKDVSGTSISELRAVVDRMYDKICNESRAKE